jgi:ubiquinone/menaquinone biosynthesis C-methylase UbiE
MKRVVALVACVLCAAVPGYAQQTALTDAQIKQAEIELPQLTELLQLKPGMTVADVGAGFGAWTVRLSKIVGPNGRVYANDVGATQLAWLKEYAAKEKATNVTVVEGGERSTNLPAGCCDAVLIRDAYHHLTQPDAIVASMAAALKPGGRMIVIDFPPRANSEVPAGVPANRLGHGVPPAVVMKEVGAQLTHVRTIDKWAPNSTQADLYLLLFRKP